MELIVTERDLSRDQSQDERPAPLSSPDCDLRGMEWMPLNAADLLDSELFLESTGEEFKAAMALICASWRQVPAGSLPASDRSLATLSRAEDWTSVRTMAMRNWVLCSDGRYYHPIVAAKAMEALPHRQQYTRTRSADADRKARERADRQAMFATLRAAGIVMRWDAKTSELRAKVAELGLSHLSRTSHASHIEGSAAPSVGQVASPDSCAGNDEFVVGEAGLPPENDVSQGLSHHLSRDKSRLRQRQGQILKNPSGSFVGAPAAPSPTNALAPKKAKRNAAAEPAPDEPLEGPKQRSNRPLRQCPQTFRLTRDMVAWAELEYPNLNLEELRRETRAFLNHRFRTARIEWVPTWENWIKEASERKASRTRPAGTPFASRREQQIAQHMPGIAAAAFPQASPPPRGAAPIKPDPDEVIDAETVVPRIANH